MYFEFANVLVYLVVSALFIFGSLLMPRVLGWVLGNRVRPHDPTPMKLTTYECGEDTIGSAWIQFNVRFYIIALIFLIFDVEIAILFPWATIFKKVGFLAFVEMFVFISILVVGFAYVWAKGDLQWLRSIGEVKTGRREPASGDGAPPA